MGDSLEIGPDETEIVGRWVLNGNHIEADEACKRVQALVEHQLQKVAISPECGAWETLFIDPRDGRYWEQTYPQGEMHGGGPPALFCLSTEAAFRKYQMPSAE